MRGWLCVWFGMVAIEGLFVCLVWFGFGWFGCKWGAGSVFWRVIELWKWAILFLFFWREPNKNRISGGPGKIPGTKVPPFYTKYGRKTKNFNSFLWYDSFSELNIDIDIQILKANGYGNQISLYGSPYGNPHMGKSDSHTHPIPIPYGNSHTHGNSDYPWISAGKGVWFE